MILALINVPETAHNIVESGRILADKLNKKFALLAYTPSGEAELEKVKLEKLLKKGEQLYLKSGEPKRVRRDCEELEAMFLLIQAESDKKRELKSYLAACRNLRIPYLYFKAGFKVAEFQKVLVPVTFLEEDYEKAQFAAAFGRFFGSVITVLQANDYGSKAAGTTEKMKTLFDKFDFAYHIEKAVADSYKIHKESVNRAQKEAFDMMIISASREYGLDDLLFGPPELHLIHRSDVPLLLINPRGDLYSLCD